MKKYLILLFFGIVFNQSLFATVIILCGNHAGPDGQTLVYCFHIIGKCDDEDNLSWASGTSSCGARARVNGRDLSPEAVQRVSVNRLVGSE